MESLAMAFPITAKVFATYVQKIASEESGMLSSQKFCPKPCCTATWMKIVKLRRKSYNGRSQLHKREIRCTDSTYTCTSIHIILSTYKLDNSYSGI